MKKTKNRIFDIYFDKSIIIDLLIIIIFCVVSNNIAFVPFKLVDKSNQLNVMSNLIGTCISLAGFILAALTIIVAFKSNLKAKGIEQSENAMEMILSSNHYHNIVSVFKKAIIEFVICAVVLYAIWASADNLSIKQINLSVVCSIFTISMAIMRSLVILFKILEMEKISYNK